MAPIPAVTSQRPCAAYLHFCTCLVSMSLWSSASPVYIIRLAWSLSFLRRSGIFKMHTLIAFLCFCLRLKEIVHLLQWAAPCLPLLCLQIFSFIPLSLSWQVFVPASVLELVISHLGACTHCDCPLVLAGFSSDCSSELPSTALNRARGQEAAFTPCSPLPGKRSCVLSFKTGNEGLCFAVQVYHMSLLFYL